MFIGPDEILNEEKDTEGFTKVFFKPIDKDGVTTEVLPKVFSDLILDELKTEEPTDLNFIRQVRCTPAVKEMLEVLLKYNVQLQDEVQFVLRALQSSLDENYQKGDDKAWGIEGRFRTMLDLHKLLKE